MTTKKIPRSEKGGSIYIEEQATEKNHARKLLAKVKKDPLELAKVPVRIDRNTTIFINPKKKKA